MTLKMYAGVDGGGTHCRVRIRDAAGRMIGAAEGGSANVYLDFATALQTIRHTIHEAAPNIDGGALAVGLGLAGVSSAEVGLRVSQALTGFASVLVDNDGVIACLGAHAGGDGGLVIAGTGSVAVLRLGDKVATFGGRGIILGDDGSGAHAGRAAWRLALRAFDDLEPWTPLLHSLMLEFGYDPVAVIDWARTASSGEFARYAPRILAAANEQDQAALTIARTAGHGIGELVLALAARGAPRISLVGGLSSALLSYLDPEARAHLRPPIADALEGALLMAGLPAGQVHAHVG